MVISYIWQVDVEARQFIKKFSEVRFHQDGSPELLILKEWPSTNALEDFLYYQRPDFISRLPLLEYIHWKWGFLNLAAKLPHDSLQPDVALKLFMAYGTPEELHRGNSVLHLHSSMTDVVSTQPLLYPYHSFSYFFLEILYMMCPWDF